LLAFKQGHLRCIIISCVLLLFSAAKCNSSVSLGILQSRLKSDLFASAYQIYGAGQPYVGPCPKFLVIM